MKFICTNVTDVKKISKPNLLFPDMVTKHWQVDLLQMKMKNEQLKLNIQLYMEQIKFLKELILIQETFRNPVIRPIGMNQQHPSSAIEQ